MIKYIVLHIIDNFYFLIDYLLQKLGKKEKKYIEKRKKKLEKPKDKRTLQTLRDTTQCILLHYCAIQFITRITMEQQWPMGQQPSSWHRLRKWKRQRWSWKIRW